jgi:hypothetical protein
MKRKTKWALWITSGVLALGAIGSLTSPSSTTVPVSKPSAIQLKTNSPSGYVYHPAVKTSPSPVRTTQEPSPTPVVDKSSAIPSEITTTTQTVATASCRPLTNSGRCYEPGEFCRATDHGITGLSGDGKTITCKNNNGWRWED